MAPSRFQCHGEEQHIQPVIPGQKLRIEYGTMTTCFQSVQNGCIIFKQRLIFSRYVDIKIVTCELYSHSHHSLNTHLPDRT